MRNLIDQAGWIFRSHLATVQPLDDQQRLVTRIAVGFLILPAVFVNQSLANGLFCVVALFLGFKLPKAKWLFFWGFLATFLVGLGVIYRFEEFTTSSVFAAFLSQIIALKTWELRSSRDTHFAVYGALFAVFTGTLSGNIELFGVLVIPQVIVAVGALFYAESKRLYFGGLSLRFLVRYLPLMSLVVLVIVTLFALFPRIGGGFLDFGLGSTQQVGLSDRVRPGALSSLAGNDDVVFRVWGEVPPDSYWRVFVMDQYRDGEWITSDNPVTTPELFAGDLRTTLRMEIESTQLARLPRIQWSALSVGAPSYGLTQQYASDSSRYLDINAQLFSEVTESYHESHARIPQLGPAPRLEAWLDPIRGLSLDKQIQVIGDSFRETKTYSVTPELQDISDIDQMWFEVDEGYCGYFAGIAAEALMRLGHPVRMVTGFLGHDRLDGLDYALIRQSHAHAWIDVYDGESWRSIDPTTWVVDQSGSGFLQSPLQSFLQQRSEMAGRSGARTPHWLPRPVQDALVFWARMNEQASRFLIDNVLYFDRDKQMQLYRWMMDRLIWVLGICVLVLGLFWLIWKCRKSKSIDPYLKQYDRLIQKIGLVRSAGMLPGDEESDLLLAERREFLAHWLAYQSELADRQRLDDSLHSLKHHVNGSVSSG